METKHNVSKQMGHSSKKEIHSTKCLHQSTYTEKSCTKNLMAHLKALVK